MRDFKNFSKLIHAQYDFMAEHELYVVNTGEIDIFDKYLSLFPEGENPIFRERTEHDCSCCKQFLRNMGAIVAIINGKRFSIWEVEAEHPYNQVAKGMSEWLNTLLIDNVYRSKQSSYGAIQTNEYTENGNLINWFHFHGETKRKHYTDTPNEVLGSTKTLAKLFERGLRELTLDSLNQVVDLINSKSIYRGTEHLNSVLEFQKLKTEYDFQGNEWDKNKFIWKNISSSVVRFRNTVIGTLVTDLSDGMDLEKAVGVFESKVAPENYKRSSSLITPSMIKNAMDVIKELDLEPALNRRMAKLSDISVNDVLFVDNSVRGEMQDGIEKILLEEAVQKTPNLDGAEQISIKNFISHILPSSTAISMLVSNSHKNNFATLTAPVDASSKNIFKWPNNFAWSYEGNLTDSSIKTRVKNAGGDINAYLRVSLAWFNGDDLDIHCRTPSNERIYFNNKAGILDVDMNAGGPSSREPIENLSWDQKQLQDGDYKISVNNYSKREAIDIGFELEFENEGIIETFSYNKPVRNSQTLECLTISVKNKMITQYIPNKIIMSKGVISLDHWNIKTETLVKVNTITTSPNYWDELKIGNKHWFFILDGCKTDVPVRGIYNEFLTNDLTQHRKVFEILGDKTKCPVEDIQLSGVGFSSTQENEVTVLVTKNNKQKPYKITF